MLENTGLGTSNSKNFPCRRAGFIRLLLTCTSRPSVQVRFPTPKAPENFVFSGAFAIQFAFDQPIYPPTKFFRQIIRNTSDL